MKLFTAVYETKQNKLNKQNSFLMQCTQCNCNCIDDSDTESDIDSNHIQFHRLGVSGLVAYKSAMRARVGLLLLEMQRNCNNVLCDVFFM